MYVRATVFVQEDSQVEMYLEHKYTTTTTTKFTNTSTKYQFQNETIWKGLMDK